MYVFRQIPLHNEVISTLTCEDESSPQSIQSSAVYKRRRKRMFIFR